MIQIHDNRQRFPLNTWCLPLTMTIRVSTKTGPFEKVVGCFNPDDTERLAELAEIANRLQEQEDRK